MSVPTPVLFVPKPRLEGRVPVMQEKLSFGIGLPSYEFQDSCMLIRHLQTAEYR
jgi:hypothetical protein